jgi:hypothetical protein
MTRRLTIICGMLLAASTAIYGQSSSAAASPAQAPAKSRQKNKAKTQQEILLEQLNEKFAALDKLNDTNEELERQIQDLKTQLENANKAAAAAQATADQAERELGVQREETTRQAEPVKELQKAVADVRADTAAVAATVHDNDQAVKALEHPDSLHFKGIQLTPGGFVAAEGVERRRGTGSDINTPFSSIPFTGQSAGQFSEFNASARQSRVSLLAEGKLPSATMRGYFETDFLSAGATSNDNQSNSYTMRVRQAWAQAQLSRGWTITGGQMWSLATEYKSGLANLKEAIPMTIDAQYNVGFTWARQFAFRVVKDLGKHAWLAASVEEPQTLNIGGHNLPALVYQSTGTGGGLYNPTANYSYNRAPDLIAKIAIEPGFGHYEVFGVGRFFRDRVFPNAQLVTGASAAGAYDTQTAGGGLGVNARVSLLQKKLDVGLHGLIGDGIGRYSSATLPDVTAHPNGSFELLTGGSALGSVEWHPYPRLDVYGYYGGEYDKRAFYWNGQYLQTTDATNGLPVYVGYGAPTNVVSGCNVEVLPTSSPNGGGTVPGSATNCNADNRNIQEGTFGYWYRFYRGSMGTLQQGIQYSYVERHTWLGIGDTQNGLGYSPKAVDNMWFFSFRYYLPQ